MFGTILRFFKFNNFGTHHSNGPRHLFFHSAALPGIYLSPCVYLSLALIQINTVYILQSITGICSNSITDHQPSMQSILWPVALQWCSTVLLTLRKKPAIWYYKCVYNITPWYFFSFSSFFFIASVNFSISLSFSDTCCLNDIVTHHHIHGNHTEEIDGQQSDRRDK